MRRLLILAGMVGLCTGCARLDLTGYWDLTSLDAHLGGSKELAVEGAGFFDFDDQGEGVSYLPYALSAEATELVPLEHAEVVFVSWESGEREQIWVIGPWVGLFTLDGRGPGTMRFVSENASAQEVAGAWTVTLELSR